MKVLIVEGDRGEARDLANCLYDAGYDYEIATDGIRGLARLRVVSYAVALVEFILPRISGLELIRRMRLDRVSTPAIILSSLGDVADKVAGLNAGADDYLVRPYAQAELLARIAAVVRRGCPPSSEEVLRHHDLVVDPRSHRVRRGEQHIELTANEYLLLEHLLRHPGRIFSPRIIAESVWGLRAPLRGKAVETRVYSLRKKLRVGGRPDIIVNERGFGYVVRAES